MRALVSVVLAAACVATASGAGAVPTPSVCGESGCTPLATATLTGLLTLPDALEPAPPPPLGPFTTFEVQDADGTTRTVFYVRGSARALLAFGARGGWRLVPPDDARLLADATAGTAPFAAPRITSTDGDVAPETVASLFAALGAASHPTGTATTLTLHVDRPNPWIADGDALRIFREANVVEIRGTPYEAPRATVAELLGTRGHVFSASEPVTALLVAVVGLAVAGVIAAAARRRNRASKREPSSSG